MKQHLPITLLTQLSVDFTTSMVKKLYEKKFTCYQIMAKLSLYLTKHHAMKTYWGNGGIAPHILDLSTRWR